MPQPSKDNVLLGRRYALCVGIGTYTNLRNRNLQFAVNDANAIAERLADPQRGNFVVTVLTELTQTNKVVLEEAVEKLLSAPDRLAEDLTVIYFSCHGDAHTADSTFCLLPSDTTLKDDGTFDQTTLISIHDLARWFSRARTQNIIVLLDVCHSGGAGAALQRFKLDLSAGPNFFIIGAARQDQVARQSSLLEHGLFTHCLLRAFEQPPAKDGWLTVSQIHNFVSEEIPWFAKDQPTQIQSWAVSVNPLLPLLRNPGYPELCPLPPLWNVPFQRNMFFTGREDLLAQLAILLQSKGKTALTQPQAIAGLGGIGKTQLALEYAYRYRQDYHAILWGRADTREALISTFVSIAQLLDLPQKDTEDQMVTIEAVKAWLENRPKWLFILDNADELAMIEEFIPSAFQGHLLLTTRAQAMGTFASKLDVKEMQTEQGALLLLRRAKVLAPEASLEEVPAMEMSVAKELAEDLGGLPLALDQAGAYIEETQCGLSGYQARYRSHRRLQLLQRRGNSPRNDHPDSVVATWSLAFERIQENPVAVDLLQLCAFLHPDAIPEDIIARGAVHLGPWLMKIAEDPLLLDEAIATLRAYSLIHREGTLSIHRLVQAVLKDTMDQQTYQQWVKRTIQAVYAAFPPVTFETWSFCEQLLPHAVICAHLIDQQQITIPEAPRLLNYAGLYLTSRARYAEAEPLLQRALAIDELQPERIQPDMTLTLNELSQRSLSQGYNEVEPYTAQSLNNLAFLYTKQGRYAEAVPLYQRAQIIDEQLLGLVHPHTFTVLNNFADLYIKLKMFDQAESLLQRAAFGETLLGPYNNPNATESLNKLAMFYRQQGEQGYTEAERLWERALTLREQLFGPMHPNTATVLNNLGELYLQQGRYAEAEPLLQRALTIREQQLGSAHPDTVSILHNLALIYSRQGKL